MWHGSHDWWLVILAGAVVVLLAVPGSTAAQPAAPVTAAWADLRDIVPEGSTVVVRTRDGNRTSGRLRSLSDTAIVLDGGTVRTIPAAAVETIEGGRAGRPIRQGAARGFTVGVALSVLLWLGSIETYAAPDSCKPDECIRWSDAMGATLFFVPVSTGIGAGVGALIPGRRRLIYSAGTRDALAIAPIIGQGRRGAAIHVAF